MGLYLSLCVYTSVTRWIRGLIEGSDTDPTNPEVPHYVLVSSMLVIYFGGAYFRCFWFCPVPDRAEKVISADEWRNSGQVVTAPMVLSASCPINSKDCFYGSWIYTSPREGSTRKKAKTVTVPFSDFWKYAKKFKDLITQYAVDILLKRANPLSSKAMSILKMKRKVGRVKAKQGETVEDLKRKKNADISL